MRTNMKSALKSVPAASGQTPVEDLDLRRAVLSPGLMLTRDTERRLVVHTVGAGHMERLGTFEDAAAAWRALDELELEDDLDIAL
jgi:hypothetical protein